MKEKREYYYRILGLKPGAASDEVKSAYRRLVKLYHPDRDNSPDAQSMYKEIRIAYKVLLDQASAGETDINSVINRNYSKMKSQTSGYNYKKAQQSNVNSSKEASHTSNYSSERAQQSNANIRDSLKQQLERIFIEFKKNYKSKIPFELQNLHLIFWRSLCELFADYKLLFLKVFTTLPFALLAYLFASLITHPEPIINLIFSFHIASLVLFIFFRYYFAPSTWPNNMRFAAAIAYGAILPLLVACLGLLKKDFDPIYFWFFTAISVWILMVPRDSLKNKKEYYYIILGLKPGATSDEIKSAYRRLEKMYHPYRDNSPVAQSMYQEINKAYKVLLGVPYTDESDIKFDINHKYSNRKNRL